MAVAGKRLQPAMKALSSSAKRKATGRKGPSGAQRLFSMRPRFEGAEIQAHCSASLFRTVGEASSSDAKRGRDAPPDGFSTIIFFKLIRQ
jgi:hypothetical protein